MRKVAFTAYVFNLVEGIPSAGYELAFTDGTSEGTTLLDINPGWYSSYPNILGEANGLAVFHCRRDRQQCHDQSIFSTNGTTFTKLATIQSDASLLGWDTNKAFFRVSDAQNGSELWAADFAKNSFGLVKDILTGSGSALAGDTQAFMVGGKLVFKAYTSATQQTSSSATALPQAPRRSAAPWAHTSHAGRHPMFADGGHRCGAWTCRQPMSPSPVSLVAGDSALAKLQFDADQVFYPGQRRSVRHEGHPGHHRQAGQLWSATSRWWKKTRCTGCRAASKAPRGYKLGYSDGTAAGTRVIEDAPAPIVQALDNAVAIQTVGVVSLTPRGPAAGVLLDPAPQSRGALTTAGAPVCFLAVRWVLEMAASTIKSIATTA